MLYGLLLSSDPAVRGKQDQLVTQHAGPAALAILKRLRPDLEAIGAEHKLPLVQLSLPALRNTPRSALDPFLTTLDELVHADGRVTPFEFALQKLLTHALSLGRSPKASVVQFYSFNALETEIGLVLSALAQASTNDGDQARTAFAEGAAQLKLIESQLIFRPDTLDFAALDAALDKLAAASGPIKQRTLVAAAHVVASNGVVSVAEAELLRAIAASLDVPLPPLTTAA